MRWQDYIHQDAKIHLGKPVFIGTRISVEMVLEELAAGDTAEDITAAHPRITETHIRAALEYAIDLVKKERVQLPP